VHQVMKRNLPSHKTTEEATFLWRIPERMNEFYEANPFLVNFLYYFFVCLKLIGGESVLARHLWCGAERGYISHF
jgi:hypothetical protein